MENTTNESYSKSNESVVVTETQKYVVCWSYMANNGVEEVEATSPKEAIKLVWGGNTNKIQYIVCEKKYTSKFGKSADFSLEVENGK